MFDKFKIRGIVLPTDNLKYKILSTDDIIEKINKLVEKCSEVIEEVSPQNCQKMICHFKWNCNKLLEKFCEADSFVHFLKKNNIDLSVPLTSEAMIDSFIQSNPLYKWCPNKSNGCTFVVKMDDDSEVEEIACQCGLTYCIQCYGIPHSPFPCILIHEWAVQLDEFKFIFNNNNVICPQCFECYEAVLGDNLFCTHCDHPLNVYHNKLTPRIYPDYYDYRIVSDQLQVILSKKDSLIGVKDAGFCSTVCNIAQSFVQKLLPLPVFSFFLDKDYLCKNSLNKNFVQRLIFDTEMLPLKFEELMAWINDVSIVIDVSDEEQNTLLNLLFSIQQNLDAVYKLIKETKGLIFKLPEIQQVYEKDIQEEEDCRNEDIDEEDSIDEIEEDSGNFEISDEDSDDDIEEEVVEICN